MVWVVERLGGDCLILWSLRLFMRLTNVRCVNPKHLDTL